jgi:YidC/Oxa1 family membrane protein insertase
MWDAFISIFSNILLWIYAIAGNNFVIAIVVMTVLVRLLTHPVMANQIKSTAKMQELTQSKQWQDMQKKYKDDKEKLAAEQMKMYQEAGINPFGSCLPMLLQLPIMIAFYQSIMHALPASPSQLLYLVRAINPALATIYPNASVETLIPLNSQFLWMNLGQPEPYYILAIIVAATTWVQSKLTMPPPANPNDTSAQMSQSMAITMPLMLGWIAMTLASGLSIYFITSNLIGIAQYAALGKLDLKNLFGQKKKG